MTLINPKYIAFYQLQKQGNNEGEPVVFTLVVQINKDDLCTFSTDTYPDN